MVLHEEANAFKTTIHRSQQYAVDHSYENEFRVLKEDAVYLVLYTQWWLVIVLQNELHHMN